MPSDDTPTPPTPPTTPSDDSDGRGEPKRRAVFKPQRRASPDAKDERAAGSPATPAEPFRPEPAFRKPESRLQGDFSGKQQMRGSHLGDRYVRVIRQKTEDFERAGPGHLVATEEASEGRGPVGRGWKRVKRRLIGAPMTTAAAEHQRLSNPKALAVLSSDALSSVAYATEEIMRVLFIAGGLAALSRSLPIGAAIVALLIIVGISYRQTIKAYPQGGGAYIVAKDNLGELPSLTAGAALLTDYVLTVAVSIAAAVAAMSSAVPELNDHRVIIGIVLILFVTTVNLRGLSESGTIFAIPTYLFLVGIFIMLAIGLVRNAINGFPVHEPVMVSNEGAGVGAIGALVLLRAFASGCAALTGVEAISDGVPAFRKPESVNARKTLGVMITILAITFSGITFLAHQYGTLPLDQAEPNYQTVVSQIARQVFGGTNAAYYYIQFATMAILVLAANTSYSDFPRLAFFLARDSYIPKQFTYRGDRLAYTTGIVTLGLMASLVLAIFGGETERLIPLYALGVFLSFTISQASMCVRWVRKKEPGWHFGLVVNLTGAITTGIVAIIVVTTKFSHGAWIICIVIPLLILLMRSIHKHYQRAAAELAVSTPLDPNDIHHTVIVPVSQLNRVARQTLAYARSISDNVTAVHVNDNSDELDEFQRKWEKIGTDIPLILIESPYRALIGPLMSYLDEVEKQRPGDTITVVLPEFVAHHLWEHILHNQTALRLKAALLFRPGTVVTSVPYHLESDVEPVEA
ncbi:MAG TPA: APC family permease [Thermomicrobiales bacterium]|nr:APC family permease [Thermomicrobiales bacterium]